MSRLPYRASPEKAVALAIAVAPAIWLAALSLAGELGARAVTEAIRFSGDWALRLFWLVLFVSPARRILAAPWLIRMRRILGIGAFGLTLLHFGLYALDQQFAWGTIGLEMVLRFYLVLGTMAMIGLAVLAASSSDRAVARLGSGGWNWLHGSIHVIAVLAALHFLLRSQTNTFEPMLMLGLLAWLIGYRLLQRGAREVSTAGLIGLAVVAAASTAVTEIAWHAGATGIDAWRLLAAHLDIADGLRPAWWVLIAGLAAAAAAARLQPQRPMSRMSASSAASGSTRGQSAS
jgi:methionine sulfoxide reductase heme-binding subunit